MSPRLRSLVAGLAGAAAMIAVVTVASRVLGFARWLGQARFVGDDVIAGAYSAANTLPNILFEVAAGGALAGALIPVLAGPLGRGARDEVDRIASAVLGWALVLLIPLGGLLAVGSGPIATVLSRLSEHPEQADLIRYLVLVFAVQVPLYGVAVVLGGILQAQRRFFWPAFVPALSSIVVLVAYAVYGALADGETADPTALPAAALPWLAWGTTAGVAALSLPLLVPVWRSGVRLRPTLSFPPGVGARVRGLALAGVGALLAQQMAVLVTLVLATRGDAGTLPVFQYSQAVYLLPYAVLAVPLATATFPRLAGYAARGDRTGFARLASTTTRLVLLAAGLGATALAAAAPAVTDVFHVVVPDPGPLLAGMTPTLTVMAPGLVGFALLFHLSRALYALDRGRAAVRAAAAGWLVVVASSLVLCLVVVTDPDSVDTLVALGAGNSLGMIVLGGCLLVALRRAAGRESLAGVARTGMVLVLGGLLGGVAGRLLTDAVLALLGTGWAAALSAGVGGALLAVVLLAGAVMTLDLGTVRAVSSVDGPGPAARAGAPRGDHR